MAQFDVHHNLGPQKSVIPYVVIVQSQRFDAADRRVVIPMWLTSTFKKPDPTFNPVFEIKGTKLALNPLQIMSIAAERMGTRVASLKREGDRIIAAIDLLISRAWD